MSMQLQVPRQATKLSVKGGITSTSRLISYLLTPQIFGLIIVCLVTLGSLLPFLMSSAYAAVAAQALAATQNSSDQASRAISYLKQSLRWNPFDPNLHRMLAHTYRLNNQPEAVVASLEQAYRLQPDSLLIQQELALAYAVSGDMKRADALWKALGITFTQMVATGDAYLSQHNYKDANTWYTCASHYQSFEEFDFIFRRAIVATLAQSVDALDLLSIVSVKDHTFDVYVLNNVLKIDGANFRWMTSLPGFLDYGLPLSAYTESLSPDNTIGVLWSSGEAVAVFSAQQEGDYLLKMHVQHNTPPPVEISLGIDGHVYKQVSLARGDDSWETIVVPVHITPGIHTINIWFLNNDLVDGKDRNAVIEWAAIEEVSK